MLTEHKKKKFANGVVYVLHTEDGYPIEVTDTFLPYYTKHCINEHSNALRSGEVGTRADRWMIGVSVMSGCPVRCRFCATGKLKRYRPLTAEEIVGQVRFILAKNPDSDPANAQEFKINYTRMGEPFLNIDEVKKAIKIIDDLLPNTHHYISTIGINNSDFDWIRGNITLQLSLHSTDDLRRNDLIPYKHKLSIEELGAIRVHSDLQITVNLTLVDEKDFDITLLKKYFDPRYFFIKLSPINPNDISEKHSLGSGIIAQKNLI